MAEPITLSAMSRQVRAGLLSPMAVVRDCLERIASRDPNVHAFLSVAEKAAMEEAREAERRLLAGESRGPLDGLPIALKDLIDVEGQATTAGLRDPYRNQAERDAHVVLRLRRAGMVLMGKLNLHEAALGTTTDNPHHGRTCNPWDTARTPGGSSGGSGAAVAAGMVPAALGSDTLGSVRLPAAYCGISGLKPTHGRVSLRGVTPLCWSMDTVGPMARDVEDLALLMDVLNDYDVNDPHARKPPDSTPFAAKGEGGAGKEPAAFTLAVIEDWGGNAPEPAVAEAFQAALDLLGRSGCTVRKVRLEGIHLARYYGLLMIETEAARVHEHLLRSDPEALSDEVRGLMAYGAEMKAYKLAEAWEFRALLAGQMRRLLRECDALLTPTAPQAAFPFEQAAPADQALYTAPANLCGLPSLSIPMGFDGSGMPLGLQVTGPEWSERRLLAIGRAYQNLTEWHNRRPRQFP